MLRGYPIVTAVLLTSLLAGPDRASTILPRNLLVVSRIGIERCITNGRPPGDCQFEPLHLTEKDERNLRDLFRTARNREEREARQAEREGKVTGGVWGFVNFG